MTLFSEVMERPLDAGYTMAAERRARGHSRGPTHRVLTAVIALVCGLVTVSSVIQLRQPVPGAVAARRALEAEIQRRTDRADATQRANAVLRQQISAARGQALAGSGAGELADEVATLGRVAGEFAVRGPGIEVSLDDAPGARAPDAADGGQIDRGRVRDRDLQIIVNGLWDAGAEAITVNDIRLTALSAIRVAGEAVLVDLQPLRPPYSVKAIGEPDRLQVRLVSGKTGSYLDILRGDGIRSTITARASLDLPGAADTFTLAHARAANGSSVTTAQSEEARP
jgi:uncharacterized protein YlxW (UPF0749 family)